MTKTNQILLMGYWIMKTNICWKFIHWWIIHNKAWTCIKQVKWWFMKSFSISGTPFFFLPIQWHLVRQILQTWITWVSKVVCVESNLWDAKRPETPLWFPPSHTCSQTPSNHCIFHINCEAQSNIYGTALQSTKYFTFLPLSRQH